MRITVLFEKKYSAFLEVAFFNFDHQDIATIVEKGLLEILVKDKKFPTREFSNESTNVTPCLRTIDRTHQGS